jgi:CheY-like chemotaxis protein
LGDPLRLQQILSNIVGNAMKFTDTGFVRISVTAQKQEEQYRLTFEITDSGIGLTAQQQAGLFSPFYQADSSFTRKYGGSGLGLMISKELVELMGGIIRVSSIPNGGTTFTFTAVFDPYEFSKQEFETIALQNQYNILATDKDIHILLVEDNDLNQLVASERLKQMGFRVSIASNGLEAVEMVKNNEYDAVLMDLQMPVMDGFTATKEIRKLPGKKKLPIIALSAAVMKEDQMLATQAGMNAHIAKPIDKVVLRDILAKWLKF